MKTLALAVLLGGCFWNADPHPAGDDDDGGPPRDELSGYPTIGKDGQAGFALEFGGCERAIAERAKASLFAVVRSTASAPATVTSDDPAILEITTTKVGDDDPHFITFSVHAASSGDTDLVVRDRGNVEIDRVTLHVRPTDAITISRVWGDGPVRILAGSTERIHVTTSTGDRPNVGSGAVEFAVSGDLTAASLDDAPFFYSEGDQAFFTAGASGTGTVTASAPNATLPIDVVITQPDELTSIIRSADSIDFSASDEGRIAIGAMVGTAPVFGVQCAWTSTPAGLAIELRTHPFYGEQTGFLDSTAAFIYTATGQPGTWMATCTMPNGLSTTIPVHIGA